MFNTHPEYCNKIINHKCKQYIRKTISPDEVHKNSAYCKKNYKCLYNCDYVDLSNKWAGGGYVSSSKDIALFGYKFMFTDIINPNIRDNIILNSPELKPDINGNIGKNPEYGIGWCVYKDKDGHISEISHSGGAVGGCSHLLILPQHGIVVCILINGQNANPYITRQIAKYFY